MDYKDIFQALLDDKVLVSPDGTRWSFVGNRLVAIHENGDIDTAYLRNLHDLAYPKQKYQVLYSSTRTDGSLFYDTTVDKYGSEEDFNQDERLDKKFVCLIKDEKTANGLFTIK